MSETEQRIAEIVGELLHLDEIDVDDNFFMLGGHSLLGAQLIARLRQSFGVDIALRSLFEAPTVAALSAEVERLRAGSRGLIRACASPPIVLARLPAPTDALSLYQLLDPEVLADPYPLFRRLRTEDPVHWDPFLHTWVVTRYADVMEVLHTFSADRTHTPEKLRASAWRDMSPIARLMVKQMLFMDPPQHTRLRKLASHAFTPARVAVLRTHIQEIVDRLLDGRRRRRPHGRDRRFRRAAAGDRHRRDARRPGRRSRAAQGLDRRLRRDAGQLPAQSRPRAPSAAGGRGDDRLFPRRDPAQRTAPGTGSSRSLMSAEVDGDRLTDEEVVATCIVTMVGGQETTTNLIGNGVLTLLRHPDTLERAARRARRCRRPRSRSCCATRVPASTPAGWRPTDRELGGKLIRKGQAVMAVMAAAQPRSRALPRSGPVRLLRERTTGTSPSGGPRTSASARRWPASRARRRSTPFCDDCRTCG